MFKERPHRPISREAFIEQHVIGFDHDGVMAGSRQPVIDEYNKDFGTNHSVNEIKGFYDLALWAKDDLGVSDEEAKEIHNSLWYHRPDVLLRAKPNPGATEFTRDLTKRRKYFQIITSRPPVFTESTIEWYRVNMPWVNKTQIIIRDDEDTVGEIFKADQIKRYGITVFFEDAAHHAERIAKHTDAMVVLLNNDAACDDCDTGQILRIRSDIHRVPTLEEALKILFRD